MSRETGSLNANCPIASTHVLSDISEGMNYEFQVTFSKEDIDSFARVSGDYSPIHINVNFSRSRGFAERVVHGALLGGLVSRMVGMHLPGANALLQSVNLKFHAPVYADEAMRVCGVVEQFSSAARTLVLKVTIIDNNGAVRAQGKAQVGFTEEKKE